MLIKNIAFLNAQHKQFKGEEIKIGNSSEKSFSITIILYK